MIEKTILHENCLHPISKPIPVKCQCSDISRAVNHTNQIHSLCEKLPTISSKCYKFNAKDFCINDDNDQVGPRIRGNSPENTSMQKSPNQKEVISL